MIAGLLLFVSRHFRAFCALGVAVIAAERVVALFAHPERLYNGREWSATFYFANYADYGFLKRGLLGTLLRPLLQAVDDPMLWVLGLMVAVTLVLLVLAVVLADRAFPHSEVRDGNPAPLIRSAIALGPAGAVQLANEHGSLDHFALLLMLAALACVLRGRAWAAAPVSAGAILLHEAFAVYALPLILAAAWCVPRESRLQGPLLIALAALPAMLAVGLWGNNPAAAAEVPHGVGHRVWERGLFEITSSYSAAQVVAVTWIWIAILTLVVATWRAAPMRLRPVCLAMMSPLALNLLGVDHARWAGLGVFVALSGLALLTRHLGAPMPQLSRGQTAACLILCAPLGPLSQVHPLPWLL